MARENMLPQLATTRNESFEGILRANKEFNQKLDVLAHRIEALRKEEARRYEVMMQEDDRRHEQLLELIRCRVAYAGGKGAAVQALTKEKEQMPTRTPVEKRASSLANDIVCQPTAMKEVEQRHLGLQQKGINQKHAMKWGSSDNKLGELPKKFTPQPPLPKPAHNIPNVHIATATGGTPETTKSPVHSSRESVNYPYVEKATTNEKKKMQGLTRECRGKGVLELQCKNSPLHAIPPPIEIHVQLSPTFSELLSLKIQDNFTKSEYKEVHAMEEKSRFGVLPYSECREFETRSKVIEPEEVPSLSGAAKSVSKEKLIGRADNFTPLNPTEGKGFTIYQGPREDNPARIEDLRLQELILNPSLVEAGLDCFSVNGCERELGPIIRRAHPSSLSLPYEIAKLKESTGKWEAALHLAAGCQSLTVGISKGIQAVQASEGEGPQTKGVIADWWFHSGCHNLAALQDAGSHCFPTPILIVIGGIMRGSTLSWCKQREPARGNLKEQLSTKQQGVKNYTDESSKRAFEERGQKRPRSLALRASQQNSEKESKSHTGSLWIVPDLGASKAAGGQVATPRRPKSEPWPQQRSPYMPLVGGGKGSRAPLENTPNQCLEKAMHQPETQEHAKGGNLGGRVLRRGRHAKPASSLRTRMIFKGDGV